MKKLLLLTAAIFVFQAVPALAQESAPSEEKKSPRENSMFEQQDINKDGSVSEDEFLNFGKKRFVEIDSDKSGAITKEEAKKHYESKREKWKQKREEMKAKREAMKPDGEVKPE